MAYTKNNWAIYNPNIPDEEQPDAFLTKSKLQNIEDGIEAAHLLIKENATNTTTELKIGEVSEGEVASAEIVDGKLNLVLPKATSGTNGKDGVDGKDGHTPVKGDDYFTEEDKTEIRDAVIAMRKVTPYFNEEANVVAGCGVHITVEAASEPGKLRVHWFDQSSKPQELIVPEGVKIAGGGVSDDIIEYYPATSVTLNSGYVDAVIGGCFGNGSVGHSTVIINGGIFKDTYVSGGGMHWADKSASVNIVGKAEVFINGTGDSELEVVYAGSMSGDCSAGSCKVTVNGGNIAWLSGGGSNGYTSYSELEVNGGNIKVLQGCNRGVASIIKTIIKGGKIDKLYAGGETADSNVTASYDKVEMIIEGGIINESSCGTNGGVVDASKVSGTYVNGIISDDVAASMNLTKTMSVQEIYQKLIDMGL